MVELSPMPTERICEAYRERIAHALVDGRSLRAVYTELREDGFAGSYSTLKRFVRRTALRETMQMAA